MNRLPALAPPHLSRFGMNTSARDRASSGEEPRIGCIAEPAQKRREDLNGFIGLESVRCEQLLAQHREARRLGCRLEPRRSPKGAQHRPEHGAWSGEALRAAEPPG